MNPDDYQKAWRAESRRSRISVDMERLAEALARTERDFRTMIAWRDYREAGIAVIMLPMWFYLGIETGQPWTWYLTVPALCWVIGFIVVDRIRYRPARRFGGDSLLEHARESLRHVNHQIWLLRNVSWWYLLPFAVALLAYFTQVTWMTSETPMEAFGTLAALCGFVLALYGFIYYLNQRAVRVQLAPKRAELTELVECLGEAGTGSLRGEYPILLGEKPLTCSGRRMILSNVCIVAILCLGVPGILYLGYRIDQYVSGEAPKLAPFTDVRWEEGQPSVEVDGQWHALYGIDGVPIEDIVGYCQEVYPNKWQKRFAEDLVEVLSGMGHPPGKVVQLELGEGENRYTQEAAMTAGNRRAVRTNAQRRTTEEGVRNNLNETTSEGRGEGEESPSSDALAVELEKLRATYKLPAMASFSMRGGEIIEQAAVGTRSIKDESPIGLDASWHIGSNTKAMTATVAGMLVEEGLLRWDSTVGDILGARAPKMHAGHRETTLAMLLHHTSGITANIRWFSAPEDRVACAAEILEAAPEGERGSYAYSNAGYVVAGAMMEVATGEDWEELMEARLFGPLGMTGTGFGAPDGSEDPWGHEDGLFGWKPRDPTMQASDNAPVLGPAGTVHTTLGDYARFIAAHLAGAQGKGGIVSAETFATLHQPYEGGDYASGWIVTERGWAGGTALTHGGSNTLWFATVWLAPEKDMAFFAVTNAGGDTAFKAVDEAVVVMLQRQGLLKD